MDRNDPDRLDKLEEGLKAFGEVSGNPKDRLAEVEPFFEEVEVDPFELYLLEDRHEKITEESYNHWKRAFKQWKDFMTAQNRHPACPSRTHVSKFVVFQRDDLGNTEGDVKKKLFYVNAAYKWMQDDERFKTPTDFNPFNKWLRRGRLDTGKIERSFPRVSIEELRERVGAITNIRERAVTVTHLKTGIRSSELGNINLRDINIKHPEVREHYPQIGTHPKNEEHPNSVYIPSERSGNKREVSTILPLDEETRQCIVDWLLIRPDNGKEALFFTEKGKRISRTDIYYMWQKYWWPDYKFDEDDEYDSITPHFARHWFTTWFRNQDVPEVKVKYMRGDKTNASNQSSAIDLYIHGYYEDIEDIYREKVFPLRLRMV